VPRVNAPTSGWAGVSAVADDRWVGDARRVTVTAVRDAQRQRVYEAEELAFGQTLADESAGLGGMATLAGILFADLWWVDATGGVVPRVVRARSDAHRSTASRDRRGDWVLRIAPGHDQPPTLSHEAAHVLTTVATEATPGATAAAHGPVFRAAHLDVATVVFGAHGRQLLAHEYRKAGLDVAPRTVWPEPPIPIEAHGIVGVWRRASAL
jgi:hypothetical protein